MVRRRTAWLLVVAGLALVVVALLGIESFHADPVEPGGRSVEFLRLLGVFTVRGVSSTSAAAISYTIIGLASVMVVAGCVLLLRWKR